MLMSNEEITEKRWSHWRMSNPNTLIGGLAFSLALNTGVLVADSSGPDISAPHESTPFDTDEGEVSAYSPAKMAEYLDSYHYDQDPTIIQYTPAMPSPEPDRRVNLMGVTLHWWEFDANGDIDTFARGIRSNESCGPKGCTSQYAITKYGEIYRMMNSPLDYAYHAGRPANITTVGIEIEGVPENFDINNPNFNAEAFIAAVELTAEITDDFNLRIDGPIDCGDDDVGRVDGSVIGIHGHHEYEICLPQGKTDPGDWYVDAIKDQVRQVVGRDN